MVNICIKVTDHEAIIYSSKQIFMLKAFVVHKAPVRDNKKSHKFLGQKNQQPIYIRRLHARK